MPESVSYWIQESVKHENCDEYYELDKEIGRGRRSVVYRCVTKGTTNQWAVKEMQKHERKSKKQASISLLKNLKHPNLVRFKEVYETEDKINIVMELQTGGTVLDRLTTIGTYSEKDAAKVIKETLEALNYLHDNEVIHRDLKPENLLYENSSDEGNLKVTDYGMSEIDPICVQSDMFSQTPVYCAPELLMGEKWDKTADLYAVGVLTYILLSGREPFQGESPQDRYKKIMKGEYDLESHEWEEISFNGKDFIPKLMCCDADRRLTAAQALNHPWVRGSGAKSEHLETAQEGLREINKQNKQEPPRE